MPRLPRKWSAEEDQALRAEVLAQLAEGSVKDWCRVASKLQGRTNKDCRKRWFNAVNGGLKKGQWAKSEDMLLRRGVERHGQRWTLVADEVQSRSADQCAKRWQQSLDPELDRSEWSEQEDRRLLQAVSKIGRHWKEIQQLHFLGRSKNCIKNRYTVLTRRIKKYGDDTIDYLVADNNMTPDGDDDEDDGRTSDGQSEAETEYSPYYEHDSEIDSATGNSPSHSSTKVSPIAYQHPQIPTSFWDDDGSIFSPTTSNMSFQTASFDDHNPTSAYETTPLPTEFPTPTQQAWWNLQHIPLDSAFDPSFFQDTSNPSNSTDYFSGAYFNPLPPAWMYSTTTSPSLGKYTMTTPNTSDEYGLPTQFGMAEAPQQYYKVTMTLKQPCTETMTSLMKMAVENGASFVVERDP